MLERFEAEGIVEPSETLSAEQVAALDPISIEMAKTIANGMRDCSPEYRQRLYANLGDILSDWHNRLNDVIYG